MKKIIINESNKDAIYNFLDSQKIPKFLLKALKRNNTSLGKHPAFPPDEEYGFDEKIALKRFEELKKSLNGVEEVTDYSEENIQRILNKLVIDCQEKERPVRKNLEKICFNTINNLFNIPLDFINFSCNLTDSIDNKKTSLRLTPESVENIEFNDIEEMESISEEVYKRRLINALIAGGSMRLTDLSKKYYLSEVFELNNKLPELYSKIIKLSNYLSFIKSEKEITDKDPKQGAFVNVCLGLNDNKSKIESEGIIFPFLLLESIKGFMELFASHGLPKQKEMALYVIKKSDFLKADLWDMRLGPILWEYFINSFNDDDSKIIPNIFEIVIELPCKDFFKLMREIFGKTKKGKNIMNMILNKVKHDNEFADFEKKLDKKRDNFNDKEKYITINELY